MTDIIRSSDCVEVPRRQHIRKRHWVGTPSTPGFIKVNTDGSFPRDLSREGIRGVFRDSKGRVLFQFGREVSVDFVFHAVVLA